MNIPMSWLRDVTDIQDDVSSFAEKMTVAGNAVEGIARLGADITGVVVGRIVSLERHPDADKLWVTKTDIGTDVIQIVTGADNLSVGDYIPVALNGATLANGLKIKKSKMRGIESNGMLCSIGELGYTSADFPETEEEGIYVFPNIDLEKHPLGSDAKPVMQLDEDVVDFDVLSNRPDTNCVIGMAREAAAVYALPFTLPEITLREEGEGAAAELVSVEIKNTSLCRRFTARVVKNVKVGPSPQWLRRRLSTSGVRPINNIVDITNYVMLEYGQPLHAFDINAVAKKNGKHGIIVRTAGEGETFTTLDGVPRNLNSTNLLVADNEKAIGIAGVMGGENSMIREDTTTILFESANFDAANIRLTARGLGMRTDASARFEKGQDPNQPIVSVNRAMELVELLNCGEVVPGVVDEYPVKREPKVISFEPAEINKKLGLDCASLDKEAIRAYLRRVGIKTREAEGNSRLEALIPTFRADISGAADLAEEVARFYGYNNIPSRYRQVLDGEASGKTPRRRREDGIKQTAAALGYFEAITFPFESPKVLDKLNIPADHPVRESGIYLKNPLNEEYSLMRTEVVLGGLLECLARNYKRGGEEAALFEICYAYLGQTPITGLPKEMPMLVMAAYGGGVDYLSIKGDVEELIASLTHKPQLFKPQPGIPYMHPGRTADAAVKPNPNPRDPEEMNVGFLGEVHPAVLAHYGIGTRVCAAVLGVGQLHALGEIPPRKFAPLSVYPPITRDLAFKVPETVPAADIEAAIRERGGQILAEVKLFDVYHGPQVGEGYKSVAYALRFRDNNRTLTVEDVAKPIAAIIQNLEKKLGAEVRAE